LTIRKRQPQSHVAFGAGSHYCLGAGAARAAVDALLVHLSERGRSFRCEQVELAPEAPTLRYRRVIGALR
jgi:cytochrome P450